MSRTNEIKNQIDLLEQLFENGSYLTDIDRDALVGPFGRKKKIHFDETHLICDLVQEKKDGTMIDVGAHFGGACTPFLDNNWRVYAFEPDPNNRKILKRNVQNKNNIFIFENAVSNISGETVPFYASDESTGISSLSAFRDGHREICRVKTVTLSDVCKEHKITKIDFLKIDTEGFDLMVLKGVPWDMIKPEIIECEFEDLKTEKLGYCFQDMADFLTEKGYYIYVSEWHPIVRYGIAHSWHRLTKYPSQLSNNKAWGNLLAFKDKPNEELLLRLLRKRLASKAEKTEENANTYKKALNEIRHKLALAENELNDYSMLKQNIEAICQINTKTEPLRKLKAYKKMMEAYDTIR